VCITNSRLESNKEARRLTRKVDNTLTRQVDAPRGWQVLIPVARGADLLLRLALRPLRSPAPRWFQKCLWEEARKGGFEAAMAPLVGSMCLLFLAKPETRNPKPEPRNPKPETRNPKSRIPKPETRTPNPESRNPDTREQELAPASRQTRSVASSIRCICLWRVDDVSYKPPSSGLLISTKSTTTTRD